MLELGAPIHTYAPEASKSTAQVSRVRLMRCAAVPYIIFGMQINTGTGIGLVIGILKTEEMFGKR